jgi:hypothetical protein
VALLHGVATMAQAEERHEDAARLLRESLALHRELDDEEGIAWSLDHLGLQALDVHEYDRAYRLSEEALSLFQRQNHAWGTAILSFHVGVAALARNDLATAEQRFEQAMVAFRDLANTWGLVSCLIHRGFAALARPGPRGGPGDAAHHRRRRDPRPEATPDPARESWKFVPPIRGSKLQDHGRQLPLYWQTS